jgi:hypothetical protein
MQPPGRRGARAPSAPPPGAGPASPLKRKTLHARPQASGFTRLLSLSLSPPPLLPTRLTLLRRAGARDARGADPRVTPSPHLPPTHSPTVPTSTHPHVPPTHSPTVPTSAPSSPRYRHRGVYDTSLYAGGFGADGEGSEYEDESVPAPSPHRSPSSVQIRRASLLLPGTNRTRISPQHTHPPPFLPLPFAPRTPAIRPARQSRFAQLWELPSLRRTRRVRLVRGEGRGVSD